jgi:uncharacterized membrane protein YdfJ with MMPL/SSD domain
MPWVFAFVLGAAFLPLLVTFRSLVVPLKAIALNLLSVGAAYGLLVLGFPGGPGEGLLGFRSTAGVVTSAAVIMVAVFAIFATLSMLEMKQLGVGLAAAVLIDATIVRGVLLPAAMQLLGDRNWHLPRALGGAQAPRAGRARPSSSVGAKRSPHSATRSSTSPASKRSRVASSASSVASTSPQVVGVETVGRGRARSE